MNFINFPEIHWTYGYFEIWGVMLIIVGIMLYKFKKNKWF